MDLTIFPKTSNQHLEVLNRPPKLTLEEFEALEVSEAEQKLREQIYRLEERMHATPGTVDDKHMDEIGMTPVHRFVNGLYHRELTIPPGIVVVGKRHAIEHIVMLTAGYCLCATERGVEEMHAPMTFISPAGEKRVVFAGPEGCTWVTLHPTDKTDLEEIERDVIIAEPARQLKYEEVRRLTGEKP